MPTISISAEEIFRIGNFPVTNSLLLAVIVTVIFLLLAVALRRKLREIPGTFQNFFELFLEGALSFMDTILGDRKKSERYLPLVATIFLFVVVSNWISLFPGVSSIGLWEKHEPVVEVVGSLPVAVPTGESPVPELSPAAGSAEAPTVNTEATPAKGERSLVPFLRAPGADLNFTIALGTIAVLGINLFGFIALGFKRHASKFFTAKNPVASFTGILEFLSEFVRIVSFSFRLFGNVFAGEVLLAIVGFLVPYFIPLPFLFLEVFVGFIQGLIFAMLTLVFIATAVAEDAAH
jgi:F-type H+-transporting ATPase subunit a